MKAHTKNIFLLLAFQLAGLFCFSQTAKRPVMKTMMDSVFNVGDEIKMPVILFSLDAHGLDHPSNPKDSLKRVSDFLKKYPRLVVELAFHTDYRSDPRYNQTLSYNRARTCVDYMTHETGIDPDRMTPKGYGESKPAYLLNDLVLPSKKTVKAGTRLTQQWIDTHFPPTGNKDDYETIMQQNRRMSMTVLQTDYGQYKTVTDSAFEAGDILLFPGMFNSYIAHFEQMNIKDSLKNIMEFIKTHPGYAFEIGSHTDYRSPVDYNLALSKMRAKTIYRYLIDEGIDSLRLSYKGYGESDPVTLQHALKLPSGKIIKAWSTFTEVWIDKNYPVKNNKDDYEYIMQQNRRTELKIIRTDFARP